MLNENIIGKVFNDLYEDAHWAKLTKLNHNWENDPIFETYHKQGNKQKGTNGEYVVENLLRALGKTVVATRDSDYAGTDFDMVVDGFKTEVKFSLANSTGNIINIDRFIINHVGLKKDWDRLVFCGVNPVGFSERVHMYFVEKKYLKQYIDPYVIAAAGLSKANKTKENIQKIFKPCLFKPQQGGVMGLNDDYMCTNFKELVKLPFIKNISKW